MFRLFRIIVEFPALDRFREFLEAKEQVEIDRAVVQLKAAQASLQSAMDANASKS